MKSKCKILLILSLFFCVQVYGVNPVLDSAEYIGIDDEGDYFEGDTVEDALQELGASGTVTSVAMTTPTGLTVIGSPITESGTLALSLSPGYVIPTTTEETNWNIAYSWGDHSLEGYLTAEADTIDTVLGRGGITSNNIATTGNVGIGTTTTGTYNLEVNGTADADTLTEGGNAVYNATETPGGELGGTWASPTIDDSVSVATWTLTGQTEVETLNETSADLTIQTTTSGDIVLSPADNVGIGSASPTVALDVVGGIHTTTASNLATSSGNVGIGTTAPAGLFDIAGEILYDATNNEFKNQNYASTDSGDGAWDVTGTQYQHLYLDETGSTNTATDNEGNQNGTYVGDTADNMTVAGLVATGTAIKTDGASTYIDTNINVNTAFLSADREFGFWMDLDSTIGASNGIMGCFTGSGGDRFYIGSASGTNIGIGLGDSSYTSGETFSIGDNNKHWFQIRWDASENTLSVYMDGVLKISKTNTLNVPNSDIFLGAINNTGNPVLYLEGTFDDVRYQTGLLSQDNIDGVYANGSGTQNDSGADAYTDLVGGLTVFNHLVVAVGGVPSRAPYITPETDDLGYLDVEGNAYVGGNIVTPGTVDGYDISTYGSFFIDSAGTQGYAWMSDGTTTGKWSKINTKETAHRETELTNLVCLAGDSIIQGSVTDPDIDYYLEALLDADVDVDVANQGVGGDSSDEVLARISTILAQDANYLYLDVGVNDVSKGRTLSQYLSDMQDIIDAVVADDTSLLLIGSILPWTDGTDGQAATIRAWNVELSNLCQINDIPFINWTYYFGQERPSTGYLDDLKIAYDEDGVHINEAGNELYATILYEFLCIEKRSVPTTIDDLTTYKLKSEQVTVIDELHVLGNIGIGTTDISTPLTVVGDSTMTGNMTISGNVGIGTTSISNALTVDGDIAVSGTVDGADIANINTYAIDSAGTDDYVWTSDGDGKGGWEADGGGTIDGSGTANYITKWSDSDTITDSQLFDDGTNVGIGTTVTPSKLTVVGDIAVSGTVDGVDVSAIPVPSGNNNELLTDDGAGGYTSEGNLTFNGNSLIIDAWVGLLDSSHYYTILIPEVDDGVHMTANADDGYGNHNIIITSQNNYDSDHDHDTFSTDPTLFIHSATDPDSDNTQWVSLSHNQTNGLLDVGTGVVSIPDGISTDTIVTSGNVAIGTTSTGSYALEVNGTTELDSLNINGVYTLPTVDGTADYVISTNGLGVLSWVEVGGGGDFADGGEAGTAPRTLGNTDEYSLGLLTNNISRIHLGSAGNVGIGTTTPKGILDIKSKVIVVDTLTDDAITAAIASLSGSKGIIQLLAETYVVDAAITIPDTVVLCGAGRELTILDSSGWNSNTPIILSGNGIEIRDLRLELPSSPSGTFAGITNDDALSNILIDNVYFSQGSRAVDGNSTITNLTVNNCYFDHQDDGCIYEPGNYFTITENYFYDCEDEAVWISGKGLISENTFDVQDGTNVYSIYCEGLSARPIITDNYFFGSVSSARDGIYIKTGHTVIISGNRFNNIGTCVFTSTSVRGITVSNNVFRDSSVAFYNSSSLYAHMIFALNQVYNTGYGILGNTGPTLSIGNFFDATIKSFNGSGEIISIGDVVRSGTNDATAYYGANIDYTTHLFTLTTGLSLKVTTVNVATYDLLVTDTILNVTYPSTAAVTSLTLPSAQVVSGRTIIIKDASGNAGANNITIDTGGSETIDGAATLVMSTNYQTVKLYSDGSNWFNIE